MAKRVVFPARVATRVVCQAVVLRAGMASVAASSGAVVVAVKVVGILEVRAAAAAMVEAGKLAGRAEARAAVAGTEVVRTVFGGMSKLFVGSCLPYPRNGFQVANISTYVLSKSCASSVCITQGLAIDPTTPPQVARKMPGVDARLCEALVLVGRWRRERRRWWR